MTPTKRTIQPRKLLPKAPTGIPGFDEISGGGLPKGRPTLVAGGAGSGKTLFAMEFLIHGAVQYNEPGVFVAFEENANELTQNVTALGFDLKALIRQKKLIVDHVRAERTEIEEAGEFDLQGLFIRLGYAIDTIGAKRVVLDTLEVLFAALPNAAIVRSELHRLFGWLKSKGVSAIVTGERGENTITRLGLEEYVSDCVILLDHRVINQISTRRLRIVKYRGTLHGTNEYPFLIGTDGISVLPITSLGLDHKAPKKRVSSGMQALDDMLDGKGFYRGSSILISGTAGSGKSSLAAAFVESACQRGEGCLYFAFEESTSQIVRNMRSIGLDLEPHLESGVLKFHMARPALYGLEMHLVTMYDLIKKNKPEVVVLDPITDFFGIGSEVEVKATLTRMIDFLKTHQITALFTSFTTQEESADQGMVAISSLIDTWISVRNLESKGERQRGIYVIKSRGMAHTHQIRSFLLTDTGIKIGEMEIAGRRTE